MKKMSILIFVAILSITTFAAEATEEAAPADEPQSVSQIVESVKTFIAENGIQFLINLVTAAAIFFIGKWVAKTIAGLLKKAMDKVAKKKLDNVDGLHEMDASALGFADESFDTVVAMYVMTVVPDPEKVMRELERVCAPGGEVVLVNHFSQEHGMRGFLERKLAPFADLIGWHAVFEPERVLICEDLRLAERRPLWPVGLFTMLRFVKEPGFGVAPQAAREFLAKGRKAGRAAEAASSSAPQKEALARRMRDLNYWRSLYRRLQSQLAER